MPPTKRYKWTNPSTKLLISIWANESIQNQMRATSRTQPIWDSIGRYMTKRGFSVSGHQCRTRIKNMSCLYQEAIRSGDTSPLEPYFETFHKIIPLKLSLKKSKESSDPQMNPTVKHEWDSDDDDDSTTVDAIFETATSEPTNQDDDDEPVEYSTSNSPSLETFINNALNAQTQTLKQMISDSVRTMERLLGQEREKMQAIFAVEAEHRHQFEVRLDRLLSRMEATTIPQLTYMGDIAAERELIDS